MRYSKKIFSDYNVTDEDLLNIKQLKGVMEKYSKEFIQMFGELLDGAYPEHVSKDIVEGHGKKMKKWFEKFFAGSIDNDYIMMMSGIGRAHSKHKIDPDKVSGAFSFVRKWMHEKVFQNVEDDILRKSMLLSMHKLLDINNDLITSAYYEEEIKQYSKVFSFRNFMVSLSERFSTFMHIILAVILIIMTIGAVIMFGVDTFSMLSGHTDHLMITALGSLLIIWVLVELLHTEIQMIKGGKFKISVFVGVAMIAFVRDLLITTLKHEQNSQITYFFLASIVGLGVIYWLISYTEKSDFGRRTK